MASLQNLVNRILKDGVMTSDEHDEIINAISADGKIDEEESAEISRIFTLISEDKIKVVNPEREKFAAVNRAELRALYGV